MEHAKVCKVRQDMWWSGFIRRRGTYTDVWARRDDSHEEYGRRSRGQPYSSLR